ncbi:hypothetical protein HY251_03525, partial [bacterium]|nr:hypothetical protein [bacterium]
FFSALLLAGLVEWMFRAGSSSRLRAVFAIDEARGYLPPHPHDPPTKRPLATLLSQARAQGLGLIVGTQHPVDLDYKALSNVGTWFLGGLRSRDLKRDLEAELKDRGVEAEVLENLPERSFLALTKDKRARAVRIRFALSYLRGPLESDELSDLPQDAPPLPERDDSGEAGSTPRAIGSASETQKSVSETPSMGPGDPSDGSPGRIDASPGPKNESPGRIDGSPGPNTESAGRIDGSQGPKMESSGLKSESPRPIESSPRSSDSPSREPIDGSDLSKDPWSKIASPPARKRVSTNSQTVPETTAFVHAAPASSCTCEKCRGKPTPGARATEWRASVFARVALTFGGDVGTPIFTRDVFLAAPLIEKDAKAIDWKTAVRLDPAAFTQRAPQGFHLFDPVPDGIFKSSGLSVLRSSAEAAARARFGLVQHEDPARGLAQREGESREAFFARVQERAKDDKRTSAESQREDVRAKLRAEVETIRRELGVSLPSDLSHAIATLVLGPYSPLHFAEKLGADSRAAESWKRPEDVRDRLERVLVALERAQAAFAKPSSAARPGLTARVLEPREVRVDAIGLAWTRAS